MAYTSNFPSLMLTSMLNPESRSYQPGLAQRIQSYRQGINPPTFGGGAFQAPPRQQVQPQVTPQVAAAQQMAPRMTGGVTYNPDGTWRASMRRQAQPEPQQQVNPAQVAPPKVYGDYDRYGQTTKQNPDTRDMLIRQIEAALGRKLSPEEVGYGDIYAPRKFLTSPDDQILL